MKLLAAGRLEIMLGFHGDLFQRFQAITGKARAQQVDAFDALLRQRHQGRCRVWLQPFGLAEARLEGHHVLFFS